MAPVMPAVPSARSPFTNIVGVPPTRAAWPSCTSLATAAFTAGATTEGRGIEAGKRLFKAGWGKRRYPDRFTPFSIAHSKMRHSISITLPGPRQHGRLRLGGTLFFVSS
jgi:hypothetical protein